MDVVFCVVVLILAAVGFVKVLTWLGTAIGSRTNARNTSTTTDDPVVEGARATALELSYDDLNVEWLDRHSAFQTHVERLSRPSVPMDAVVQLTRSESPAAAALGRSALARRDDLPDDWTTKAISSLSNCDAALEPFVSRTAHEGVVSRHRPIADEAR